MRVKENRNDGVNGSAIEWEKIVWIVMWNEESTFELNLNKNKYCYQNTIKGQSSRITIYFLLLLDYTIYRRIIYNRTGINKQFICIHPFIL